MEDTNNEFKKTILIVDDEKMIINLLTHNLKKEGYNVIEAHDGLEAIDVASREKPDLILLDIMLPKLDGLSVCKRIKNMMNVPILMVSAKDEELDKYGVNNSLTHVDFMIGSNDMNIVGITHQGEEVQVFKNGNWAF